MQNSLLSFFLPLLCSFGSPLLAQLTGGGALRYTGGTGEVGISDFQKRNITFRYAGASVQPGDEPDLNLRDFPLMFSRTEWTTPATVQFDLHPSRVNDFLNRTFYLHFVTVDAVPGDRLVKPIEYRRPRLPSPPPVISRLVNAYSLQSGVAPGTLVTLFSDDLPFPPLTGIVDNFAKYPRELGGVAVSMNGTQAPILSVSGGAIQTVVPYELSGAATLEVTIRAPNHQGESAIFSAPLSNTAPAILTSSPNGRGQVAARHIFDAKWSVNSPDNPVPPGGVIELVCTGAGVSRVPVFGDIAFIAAYNFVATYGPWLTNYPISVTIGGQEAKLLYVGTQIYRPFGLLQINAIVPEGIGPGAQPVVLKIGNSDNASQGTLISVQ